MMKGSALQYLCLISFLLIIAILNFVLVVVYNVGYATKWHDAGIKSLLRLLGEVWAGVVLFFFLFFGVVITAPENREDLMHLYTQNKRAIILAVQIILCVYIFMAAAIQLLFSGVQYMAP